MKISRIIVLSAAIAAILVAICVAIIPQEQASAAPLQVGHGSSGCSMPMITDVNPAGDGKYIVVVEVIGKDPKLVVKCGSKKVKPSKIDAHTWSVFIKAGKTYKFTSSSGSCKWTIEYKIGR